MVINKVSLIEMATKYGSVEAQYVLGSSYLTGANECEQNYKKARKWYKKAAKNGHSWAQYKLAEMYSRNKSAKRNFEKAFYWYKKSAEQGNVSAINKIASCYRCGLGVDKNIEKAVEWLKKGADSPICLIKLGIAYELGEGVKNDLRKYSK